MTTKQAIMNEISGLLGMPEYEVSTGSSEPREFLIEVASQIGLSKLTSNLSKPEIAKAIVESYGEKWLIEYDSSGSTVTKEGLKAVLRAVRNIVCK